MLNSQLFNYITKIHTSKNKENTILIILVKNKMNSAKEVLVMDISLKLIIEKQIIQPWNQPGLHKPQKAFWKLRETN